MALSVFDTKLREKVKLTPQSGNEIRMYTCGPTVYDFAHIGNLRTYVFEDILRRTIKYFGMGVYQVMNLTDVDDKTIRRANERKLKLADFTQIYKDAFFKDLEALGIERAEKYPSATDHIDDMKKMIQTLIDQDVAYVAGDGNVFFRISSFPHYGALSHLCLDELKGGASQRVNADEYEKEAVCDFVLWKAYDKERDGDVKWQAPWGEGRPGWHIECSAMALALLGETIDLHVGGVDNIFPHHENEIAQSESCTHKVFARHWMHSSHLIVDGKKMSKSLGNFYTFRDLEKLGYSGREVRYMLMATHYRMQLNFTMDGLKGARNSLERLDDFVRRVQSLKGEDLVNIDEILSSVEGEFRGYLGDDLNISGALAALFGFVRTINSLCDSGQIGARASKNIMAFLQSIDCVLGVLLKQEVSVPKRILEALKERESARRSKNWALADKLRDEIYIAGFVIEDGDEGPRVKPSR